MKQSSENIKSSLPRNNMVNFRVEDAMLLSFLIYASYLIPLNLPAIEIQSAPQIQEALQ